MSIGVEVWSSVVGGLVSAVITPLVMGRILKFYKNKEPHEEDNGLQSIDMSKFVMRALTIFSWLMVLLAVIGIVLLGEVEPYFWQPATVLIVLFGGMGILCLWGLRSEYKVSWDEQLLIGPNHLRLASFPDRNGEISIGNTERIGFKQTGYFFAETHEKDRIYWTPFHGGHQVLMQAILQRHPDLEIDKRVLKLL